MPRTSKPASYRRHKSSGQAVVTINRQDVYLGPYGSAESRELYSKLLAGIAKPEELVRRPKVIVVAAGNGITVIELLAAYWKHAQSYYVKPSGEPNNEQGCFRTLIAKLKTFAGRLLVSEFGPNRMREFRETLIEAKQARTYTLSI